MIVSGQQVARRPDNALSDFRARHIDLIFQSFNLVPMLTAYENVEYPLILTCATPAQHRVRVNPSWKRSALRTRHGGGSAISPAGSASEWRLRAPARSLPVWCWRMSPHANLDSHTGSAIIALMRQMQREEHVSFVFSSHDPQVFAAADDPVLIRDIESIERHPARSTLQ